MTPWRSIRVFDRVRHLMRRRKSAVSPMTASDWGLSSRSGGWWPLIREPFTGAWQRNMSLDASDVLASGPVWACVTLIASDIAKMAVNLIQLQNGVWEVVTNSAYSPVLRKPNHYQNRIAFFQSWLISKLTRGNTYVLKQRNDSQKVSALYVLDPQRVQTLVTPDGSVFYRVSADNLAGVTDVTVPAREIIHDIYIALFHPLVGLAPTYACGLAATQGLKIRQNSAQFFDNRASLDGILVAPGTISAATAQKLEEHWNTNYAGPQNAGKIAALGDGLKFEPLTMTARDAQTSEQLNDSALEVCAAYHVPAYMVGYGPPPNYNNIEALNAQYYAQCLQILIEALELCLDEGLGLSSEIGIEFDLDGLIRMDSASKMEKVTKGVRGGVYTPNEARKQFNLKPLDGGDTVYLQDQDHSLQWLHRRDEQPIQVATPAPPAVNAPPDETGKTTQLMTYRVFKGLLKKRKAERAA